MYLIDTDILIYGLRNHVTVKENFLKHADQSKAISVISYGEPYFGALKSKYSKKNLLTVQCITDLFPIVEISCPIIVCFAELKNQLQLVGKPLADLDLLIAATLCEVSDVMATVPTRPREIFCSNKTLLSVGEQPSMTIALIRNVHFIAVIKTAILDNRSPYAEAVQIIKKDAVPIAAAKNNAIAE